MNATVMPRVLAAGIMMAVLGGHKLTSLLHSADPPETLSTTWKAGFVGIEWVTEDFTKSDVEQRATDGRA
jgi:hypothetical protein